MNSLDTKTATINATQNAQVTAPDAKEKGHSDTQSTITQIESKTESYFSRWNHLEGTALKKRNITFASLTTAALFGGLTVLAIPSLGITAALAVAGSSILAASASAYAASSILSRSAKPTKEEDLQSLYCSVQDHEQKRIDTDNDLLSTVIEIDEMLSTYQKDGEHYVALQRERAESREKMNTDFSKAEETYNENHLLLLQQISELYSAIYPSAESIQQQRENQLKRAVDKVKSQVNNSRLSTEASQDLAKQITDYMKANTEISTPLLDEAINNLRHEPTHSDSIDRNLFNQPEAEQETAIEQLDQAVKNFTDLGLTLNTRLNLLQAINDYSNLHTLLPYDVSSLITNLNNTELKPIKESFYKAGPIEAARTQLIAEKTKAEQEVEDFRANQNSLTEIYRDAVSRAGNPLNPDLQSFAKEIPS